MDRDPLPRWLDDVAGGLPALLDRACGAYLGLAIGDALGARRPGAGDSAGGQAGGSG